MTRQNTAPVEDTPADPEPEPETEEQNLETKEEEEENDGDPEESNGAAEEEDEAQEDQTKEDNEEEEVNEENKDDDVENEDEKEDEVEPVNEDEPDGEADEEEENDEDAEKEDKEEPNEDDLDVPDELQNEEGSRAASEMRTLSRVGDNSVRLNIRGRPVVFQIPPNLRDDYDSEATLDPPDVDYNLEWAYGCPQAESMEFLSKEELIYPVGAVIVMYHIESHTQRFYKGHTNLVTSLAVHSTNPIVASGQAEGHDHESSTIQKPHIQLWNHSDASFIMTLGVDLFETSVKTVAFSGTYEDQVFLAAVDSSQTPVLRVWKNIDSEPELIEETNAHSDEVISAQFYPEPPNIMLTTGKSHVTMWSIADQLQSRNGLFTRKIPRPKLVTCAAFAQNGEVLTGDSDGNVMVWRGVKVVRVLKGAHSGTVGDIKVMDDGSFVSGGLDDDSLVIFNESYELIGAGAVLPEAVGGVKKILVWRYIAQDDARHFHLIVGTNKGCVLDVTFTVSKGTTEVDIHEIEVLIQGHGSKITGLSGSGDKFLTCSLDKTLVLWDAVAHKAKWVESVRSSLTSVVFNGTQFAAGSSDGCLYFTDIEERSLVRIKVSDAAISALAFNGDASKLAIGTKDNEIFICDTSTLPETFDAEALTGHSSHITHLDFTKDGNEVRSNSQDYEILFWNENEQITDVDEVLDKEWSSQNCTLSFETLGIWPTIADGTDINACAAFDDILAVGDDFGRVRIYKYPTNQVNAESKELLGHADHVKQVSFMDEAKLVTSGGHEVSLLQWS